MSHKPVLGGKSNTVSPKKEDHLKEDPPIKGQSYVLLSMINPQSVLDNKEVFYFNKFLSSFRESLSNLFDELKAQYPDKKDSFEQIEDNYSHLFEEEKLQEEYRMFRNQENLEKAFNDAYPNQSLTRSGIKVRYVSDSQEDCSRKAKELQEHEPAFDVMMASMGSWLPVVVDRNEIKDKEYAETQLNTLMKEYNKNQEESQRAFEERKERMMKRDTSSDSKKKVDEDGEDKSVSTREVSESIF